MSWKQSPNIRAIGFSAPLLPSVVQDPEDRCVKVLNFFFFFFSFKTFTYYSIKYSVTAGCPEVAFQFMLLFLWLCNYLFCIGGVTEDPKWTHVSSSLLSPK